MITFSALLTALRAQIWPAGEPKNLQSAHTAYFKAALVDIQQSVLQLQQFNYSIFSRCDRLWYDAMSVVEAPPNGVITKVFAIVNEEWRDKVYYRSSNMQYMTRLAKKLYAAETPGTAMLSHGFHAEDESADSTAGRSRYGYWAIDRRKLYVAPWLQSNERLVLEWSGIKNTYEDSDTIDDRYFDAAVQEAVKYYVQWQHELWYGDAGRAASFNREYILKRAELIHTWRERTEQQPAQDVPESVTYLTAAALEDDSEEADVDVDCNPPDPDGDTSSGGGSTNYNCDCFGVVSVRDTAYGAAGDGEADDTDAITEAIEAAVAGSAKTVVFQPGVYATNSFTVPEGVTIWLMHGARLSINSGETVTIDGLIDGPASQLFTGDGLVVLGAHCKTVFPEWWGAVGDGETDDSTAIQAALTAVGVGGTIRFRLATYIAESGLTFRDGQKLIGACSAGFPSTADAEMTILRFSGESGTLLAPFNPSAATRRVRIEDMELDGGAGADRVIDFTRVGYSIIRDCSVRGTKTDIEGLVIDDEGSSTAYRNKVVDSRFWVSGGGSSVNISLRGNSTSGANINEFENLFVGYANRGIEINQYCVSNTVRKVDFQGIENVEVGLYVAGGQNNSFGCWFEDAEHAIHVTTTGSLTRSGNTIGGNMGATPVNDEGFSGWGTESVPDTSTSPTTSRNFLRNGRFVVRSPVQLTTVAECEIDNPPIGATGTSVFRFFRNTTTSGVRSFEICPGDGSATIQFSVAPSTGNVGMRGSLRSLANDGQISFPAANILEFRKGSGSVEAFSIGQTGLSTSTQIQNNSGVVRMIRADGSALSELLIKSVSIPGSNDITYGVSSALNFNSTEVQFLALTGNTTFTTANAADGRRLTIYITADGTPRTLTFPGTWKWVGTAPTSIAASTIGKLTLFSRGTTDADIYADWSI